MRLVNESGQNEREKMKTTKLTLIAGIALAVAFGVSAAQTEPGSARGGAGDLIKQVTPASAPAESTVMECPKCKSDWVVKTDRGARGVNKPTYKVEKHLCQSCGTELKTIGQGKQAKDVATHTCAGCNKS